MFTTDFKRGENSQVIESKLGEKTGESDHMRRQAVTDIIFFSTHEECRLSFPLIGYED
jgi:hypothetical protein